MKIINNRMDDDPLASCYNEGHILKQNLLKLGYGAEVLDPGLGLNGAPVTEGERFIVCPQPASRNGALVNWLTGHPQARAVVRPSCIQKDIRDLAVLCKSITTIHMSLDKAPLLLGETDPYEAALALNEKAPRVLVLITGRREAVACLYGKAVKVYAFAVPADRVRQVDGLGAAFLAAFLATYWDTGRVELALDNGHANAAAFMMGLGPQDSAGFRTVFTTLRKYDR